MALLGPSLVLGAGLAVWTPSAALGDIGGQPSRVHALEGVRIVTGPASEPISGTVVIRDGKVAMVGSGAEIPPDAVRHDLTGRWLYAGWVEPYLVLPAGDSDPAAAAGVGHPNPRVRSQVRAVDSLPLDPGRLEELREAGFTAAQIVPADGVFRGVSSVAALGDGPPSPQVLRPQHAQVLVLNWGRWNSLQYPTSLMGAVALARQTLYDARWHQEAWERWERDPAATDRPGESASLRALRPLLARTMPVVLESASFEMLPRVLNLAREFGVHPIVVSKRSDHHRIIERLAPWLEEANGTLIASVDYPDAPEWLGRDGRSDVPLERLVEWERAPADLALLEAAGVDFAVTAHGLDSATELLERLRTAVAHGLSPATALAAVTTRPAALLGVSHRVGTIETDKDADFLVATGPLFEAGTRVEAVWVDGVPYGPAPRRATADDVTGEWELIRPDPPDGAQTVLEFAHREGVWTGTHREPTPAPDAADAAGPEATDPAPPASLADVSLERGVLSFGRGGETYRLQRNGAFLRGDRQRPGAPPESVLARRARPAPEASPSPLLSASAPDWPVQYDEAGAPAAVLVRGATVWTCGPQGTLEASDLLVQRGRITGVGASLPVPDQALVIDGTGLHVTPGLVDCHSHSAISGGVNECTESCTAEVRVSDAVSANSEATYRELAGGLTVANLLHGSCNPIGGQNAVIKLRWGQSAQEMRFAAAPAGIKFALGENVKRSAWDSEAARDRYPSARTDVEQFLRDRLHAADDYRRRWEEWRRRGQGSVPRRDLELDALAEVLNGTRLVHCHCYRADEILMLLRVAEDFGFRVATLQHGMEAYKVANELAEHGAGVSCFTDWWTSKLENRDAIPYASEILWRRGVNVSFNSDSADQSRRMNLEAAKAVKYGGVPDAEALKFVTLNPATQLGVDDRIGSLEVGKDGDFVLWSGHPLSDLSVCQQTWIDGVKRFDRLDDLVARRAAEDLRERLLDKAEALSGDKAPATTPDEDEDKHEDELERGACVPGETCCGD